jgi:hypothetical protein
MGDDQAESNQGENLRKTYLCAHQSRSSSAAWLKSRPTNPQYEEHKKSSTSWTVASLLPMLNSPTVPHVSFGVKLYRDGRKLGCGLQRKSLNNRNSFHLFVKDME